MEIYISIIIAVYNCHDYIRRCIDSAIDQQSENYEIIIVDDGSTDGTSEICDEYNEHERIKVIHQQNQGHTVARKVGVQEAKGQYICIVDADDWIESTFALDLEKSIERLDDTPDIISFNYNRVDLDGDNCSVISRVNCGYYNKERLTKLVYPIMLSDPSGEFYTFGVFPTLWSKAFKKEIIADVMELLDPGIVLGEDAFCVYLSFYKAESVLFIDKHLYNYQINSNSLTRKYAKNNFDKLSRLCELLDRTYPASLLEQVRRYKLSMLMGAITNETRGPLHTKDIILELKNRCKIPTFQDCIYKTIAPNCSFYRKIIWRMLKLRMYRLLVISLRALKI